MSASKPPVKEQRKRGKKYKKREVKNKKAEYYVSKDMRNARTTHTLNSNNTLTTMNPSLVYDIQGTQAALDAVANAFVNFALNRDWAASCPDPSYPYWARVYVSNILYNAATNGTLLSSSVTDILNNVCNAIRNKGVPSGQGRVEYKWTFPGFTVPEWKIAMGPPIYDRYWQTGVIQNNGGETNSFFKSIVPPDTYTEELGQVAWTSLSQFLHTLSETGKGSKLLVLRANAPGGPLERDVSAFANNIVTLGGSFANVGGLGALSQLEVPIKSPIYSVFVPGQTNAGYPAFSPVRYGKFSRSRTGDGMSLVMAQLLDGNENIHRMKNNFKFKYVDFNEIAEVVFMYMSELIYLTLDDPQVQNAIIVNGVAAATQSCTCPLTLQEVLLILRYTLLSAMSETQYGVQGTYYSAPENTNDNKFCPFITSYAVGPIPGATEMMLPMILIENIRSLLYRINRNYLGGKQNPNIYVPVLGQYYLDAFNQADWVVSHLYKEDEPPLLVNVFKDNTTGCHYKGVDKKTGKPIFGAEIPISMIDGQTENDILAIGDPGPISELVQMWNSWLVTRSSKSTTLTTLGKEAGITSCTVLPVTRIWVKNQVDAERISRKPPRKTYLKCTAEDSLYGERATATVMSQYC